jgi:hypothetical protein
MVSPYDGTAGADLNGIPCFVMDSNRSHFFTVYVMILKMTDMKRSVKLGNHRRIDEMSSLDIDQTL